MDETEGTRPINTERSEFSDFLVESAKKYFSKLALTDELKTEVENQHMLVIPYGSAARGNSVVTSDVDAYLLTSEHQSTSVKLIGGKFHPSGKSLGKFLASYLGKTRPDLFDQRRKKLIGDAIKGVKASMREEDKEKSKLVNSEEDLKTYFPVSYDIDVTRALDEIDVELVCLSVSEIIDRINSGTFGDYGKSDELSLGTYGAALATTMNIDPNLVISPTEDPSAVLENVRNTISETLAKLPTKRRQEVTQAIETNSQEFAFDLKDRDRD